MQPPPDFQQIHENEQNILMYISLHQLDELLEKLKLLNYEGELLKQMKMKPLNRHYFLKSFNPGEQFFMFTSICAWLIRKTGRQSFEQPQEFHDPTQTLTNIIAVLQELDISTDFPTNKLMQGTGFVCCYALDCLATLALKYNKIEIKRAECKVDTMDMAQEIHDNDNEIILEKFEEESAIVAVSADEDDSDQENQENQHYQHQYSTMMNNSIVNLNLTTTNERIKKNTAGWNKQYKVDPLVASENWRLEFEKALPQLKVVIKTDPRNWRAHWDQMKFYRSNINTTTDDIQTQLTKLQTEIQFEMEKIDNREKHLNVDLKLLLEQYRNVSIEVQQTRTAIKTNDQEKLEIEQQLKKLLHDYENSKMEMEQRGNTMADGSPLLNIKKSIVKIKEEIIQMELEIGVMTHTIDQEIIKSNVLFKDMDPMIVNNNDI